ncbi:MAG: hypothetical protein ACE5NA_05925 [Nitrospiraceae bacterium]
MDDLTQQWLRELLAFMLGDPQTTTWAIRLNFISENVDRIAELVVYLVRGKMIRHTVPPTTA